MFSWEIISGDVLVEINAEYVALARDRIRRAVPCSTERRSGKEEGELEIRVWRKVD